jgi:ketosteroid isomerase-like protein
MRILIAWSSVALLLFGAGTTCRAASRENDIAQLIALDRAMQRAVVDRDAKTFAGFFTDDYVLVSSSGRLYKKAEVVAEITSPDVHYEINESSDVSVRVQGDTGLVIASLHQKGIDHGKPFDYHLRYTDTWVRQGGAWRNISAHASMVRAP